jgi:hypothetical protein
VMVIDKQMKRGVVHDESLFRTKVY